MHKIFDFKAKNLARQHVVVEKSAITRIAEASFIGGEDASLQKGEHFPIACLGALANWQKIIEELHLKPHTVLISQEKIDVFELPQVGDEISVDIHVGDVYEQQGSANPVGFVHLLLSGKNGKKQLFEVDRILAVRGAFPRGRV